LRQARKSNVAAMSAAERDHAAEQLALTLGPLLERAGIVAGYHAVGTEISVDAALRTAAGLGKPIALPSFDAHASPMIFRAAPVVAPGPHGIPQPSAEAPTLSPDLVLIPLLGIDESGHRIGQGGGHYDRALPDLRASGATLIGVGWAFQLLDGVLRPDPWDVPLDGFAAPNALRMFR
jgi:5-formyltetrahydrofolate cyclo-ligase